MGPVRLGGLGRSEKHRRCCAAQSTRAQLIAANTLQRRRFRTKCVRLLTGFMKCGAVVSSPCASTSVLIWRYWARAIGTLQRTGAPEFRDRHLRPRVLPARRTKETIDCDAPAGNAAGSSRASTRADRQAAEIFLLAIVNVRVVRVGPHRENLLERDVAPAAVLLDPQRRRRGRPGRGGARRRRDARFASSAIAPARGTIRAFSARRVAPGDRGRARAERRRTRQKRPASSARPAFARQGRIRADEVRDVEAKRIEPHARHGGVVHAGNRQSEHDRPE